MHYGQRRALQAERSITGRQVHYRQGWASQADRASQAKMGIAGQAERCITSRGDHYRQRGHYRQRVNRRMGIAGRERHNEQRGALHAERGIAGRGASQAERRRRQRCAL